MSTTDRAGSPLSALVAAARGSDAAGLARALHRLRGAFVSLTEEAKLFLGELDRHTAGERLDEERFHAHKQALLAYLGRFVADLKRLAPEIAARIADVEQLDPDRLLAIAASAAERGFACPPRIRGGCGRCTGRGNARWPRRV